MIYPHFLKNNDLIGVPAPSAGVSEIIGQNKLLNAQKRFVTLGYQVELSKNYNKCQKGRSADAKTRGKEINDMVASKEIKAMICQAGGEFQLETLPYIDFNHIKGNPKFIIGFSDATSLLYPVTTKCDIATIYGQSFKSLGNEHLYIDQEYFLDIIKGNIIEENSFPYYEETEIPYITGLEDYNLTEKVYWHTLDDKPVQISGRIIGGCLDIITELAGTKYDGTKEFNERYKDDGIIWYFDNCELSMEGTIRTLWKLNELDYFKYTKGIIFGRFGQEQSYLDYDTRSCLQDSVVAGLNIPIIYDADISHKSPSMTIINGSIATIKVASGKGTITQELL